MAGSARGRGSLEARGGSVSFTKNVYMPAQRFIQTEWVGSLLLLLAAVTALLWANSPFSESYYHLWESVVTLDLGILTLSKDLGHWINDGLMAIFFFVIGLEIKREFLHGNLSNRRSAMLPILAALGGMVVPALIYLALNPSGEFSKGWGIPMATDIAFALGILGLVGRRIPSEVRIFLLALAVVDDIGAIMVIAVFYTASLSIEALAVGALLIVIILAMQRLGIRSIAAYLVVGVFFWLAIFESGIHATIAGVILGALTPSVPYLNPDDYQKKASALMSSLAEAESAGRHSASEAILGQLEELTASTEAPLERLERKVHPWSSYVVLPLFALANSGVALSGAAIQGAFESSVALGIMLGLIVGKLVGVLLFTWIGVKIGVALIPPGVSWGYLTGAALLAGVGFTVSIFITGLAFEDQAVIDQAKIGILMASLFAGVVGFTFLRLSPAPKSTS